MDKIQLKRNGSPKTAAHEIYAMSAAYSGDIDPQIRDIDPLILEGLLMM